MGENEIYIELSLRMRYVVIFGRLKYYYINASYNKRKTSLKRSRYAYRGVLRIYLFIFNSIIIRYFPIRVSGSISLSDTYLRIGYGYDRAREVLVIHRCRFLYILDFFLAQI